MPQASTLVTGGAGFVGLALVEHLLTLGEHVTVFDIIELPPDAKNLFAGLPGRLDVVRGSVLDRAALDEAVARAQPTTLVNAAAVTPNGPQEKADPMLVNQVNFNGTLEVLEVVRARKLRLLHLSTCGVYGAVQDRPGFWAPVVGEDVLPGPATLYAISKTAAEQTVQRHMELFGIDALIARVGVTWGPWEYGTGSRHVFSAPLQLLRLAHAGREAVISRESIKDWSYSRDVARGIAMLKNAATPLPSRLFNVSGDAMWAISDFARRLTFAFPGFCFRIAQSDSDLAINATLSKASDRQGLDVSRLKRETGYAPAYDFETAFTDYLGWAERTTCWR